MQRGSSTRLVNKSKICSQKKIGFKHTFTECLTGNLLDLAFIVDSSGSIEDAAKGNWNLVLDFIATVVAQYQIGENDVRVSMVVYSTKGEIKFYLDQYYNKTVLLKTIRETHYVGGRTNTADGLQLTWQDIFRDGYGDRPDVANVAILITDGIDNEREEDTLPMAEELRKEAEVIVVGITDKVDRDTLEQIATNPEEVFLVTDFNVLVRSIATVLQGICPEQTIPSESSVSFQF
jgi:hypothetical protein